MRLFPDCIAGAKDFFDKPKDAKPVFRFRVLFYQMKSSCPVSFISASRK